MNEAGRDEARAQALIDAITNTPMAEFVERRGELCSAANAARLTTKELVTALRARRELPRQLERSERDTLLAILGFADFEGRDEFVVQVDAARVTGYCSCLCASVDLEVDRDAPRSSARHDPIPNEAGVLNEAGDEIGGGHGLRRGRLPVVSGDFRLGRGRRRGRRV